MKFGLIRFTQETDTFNPIPTTLQDFEDNGVLQGRDVLATGGAGGTVAGYMSAVAESHERVETVPILDAGATAGGRVDDRTLRYFENLITRGLDAASPLDGLAAHFHGACSALGQDDVDGHLLEVCRQVIGPRVPIVATLDHHANITQRMIDNCDMLVGYRTQPHDPFETGKASTDLLLRLAAGRIRPALAWRKLRLISHQEQYLTSHGPMKVWFDRARALEQSSRVLSVSNFPMQPWLDVEEGGWATVVITDGDQALAERAADDLAELAWSLRDEYQRKESLPVGEAVRVAQSAPSGVVVLSDTGDSVLGGAAGDSTVILEALLSGAPAMSALVPMVDAPAVSAAADAGEGSQVTLLVGGGLSSFFRPVPITGTVRKLGSGRVPVVFPAQRDVDMGRFAVLDSGSLTILITERKGTGGVDPGAYRAIGIEPRHFKAAVLKTASNFQYFAPIATQVVRVDTAGPTQSEIVTLPWSRIPRPIYPLDYLASWRG